MTPYLVEYDGCLPISYILPAFGVSLADLFARSQQTAEKYL
jgi:hypothetical protein